MIWDVISQTTDIWKNWARQGVLMLNTVLTVRAHQANSHRGIGWEEVYRCGYSCVGGAGSPDGFLSSGAKPAQS